MIKKTAVLVSLIIICGNIFLANTSSVYAQEESSPEELFNMLYDETEVSELLSFDEDNIFFEITGFSDIKSMIAAIAQGSYSFSLGDFFRIAGDALIYNFKKELYLIVTVLVLCILYSVFSNSASSYLETNVKNSVFCAAFLSLCTVLLNTFYGSVENSTKLITSLVSFMNSFIPFLLLSLSTSGAISTTSPLSPTLLFFTNLITYLVNSIIIPVSVFGFILTLLDNFLDIINISYLYTFLKKASAYILGACYTIFGALIAFEGVTFSSIDGAGARAAKYTVSTLVPVIGGFLSDSADTIRGFLLIIKNSIGIIGVILVLCIVFTPVLKLLCVSLALRLSSIVVQPIAQEKIGSAVDSAASYLFFITVCIASVGVMFIVIIGLLIYFGNYVFMMR